MDDALRWSSLAAASARLKLDNDLQIRTDVARGICLIYLGKVDEAMSLLEAWEHMHNVPVHLLTFAYGEYLLTLAKQRPYPEVLCRQIEGKLAGLSTDVPDPSATLPLDAAWAITASKLQRAPAEHISPAVFAYAELYKHQRLNCRAIEVLEFGAGLLEVHGDLLGAYALLKASTQMKR
ncbi:MAG: hypothetical protein DDT34_02365 [Firmicutes bacterium]|nr:hypothetical protein [Bacillota bacterium]